MSLSTQTNKISGVINFPKDYTPQQQKTLISQFKSFCESYATEYYFILHNRDVTSEGEFKTPHIHYLLDTTGKSDRCRLLTHLKNISNYLQINTFCISIEPWRNTDSMIQYLIHKNDEDKVRYASKEIITNVSETDLSIILEKDVNQKITIDLLVDLVKTYKTKTQIYQKLGLDNSKKFRNLISDIYNDYYTEKLNHLVKTKNQNLKVDSQN